MRVAKIVIVIKGASPLTRSASCDTLCPVPGCRPVTIDDLGQTHTVPGVRPQDRQGQTSFEMGGRSSPSRVPP